MSGYFREVGHRPAMPARDPLGKAALFSDTRRPGTVVIECSSCGASTRVSYVDFALTRCPSQCGFRRSPRSTSTAGSICERLTLLSPRRRASPRLAVPSAQGSTLGAPWSSTPYSSRTQSAEADFVAGVPAAAGRACEPRL